MEEFLKGLMDEIEAMEAEICRKRYIYYHIQNWVHTGLIQDEAALVKVEAYCDILYPDYDLPQCYEMAMEKIRKGA